MKAKLLLIFVLLLSCGQQYNKQLRLEKETVEMVVPSEDLYLTDSIQIEYDVEYSEEQSIEPEPKKESSSNPNGSLKTINRPFEISGRTISKPLPAPKINAYIPAVKVPKYEMGKFVYEIPNEMLKLETYTVKARISRSLVDVKIYKDIHPVVDTTIRTSKTMQVELIDPSGDSFKIISQSAKQFIEVDEPTEWVFFVTPLNYGQAKLSIVVSIIKDGNVKQTVYNGDVVVKTTTWLEIKLWFSMYWQWFTVVLLIPLIRWIQNKFSKKEKS